MAMRAQQPKMITELVAILIRIPVGRVLAIGALSQHFRVSPRAIETAITSLHADAGCEVPWHRVVMDGGALGQLGPRAEHLARLRAEGLQVAPAGIVQDMDRVAIRDVAALPARPAAPSTANAPAPLTPPSTPPGQAIPGASGAYSAPARSRGRLGAPKSTV